MKFEEINNVRLVGSRTIRCNGVRSNGSLVELELKVPENEEKGVNEYFDYIIENHNWDAIVEDFKIRSDKRHLDLVNERERKKNQVEFGRLQSLFDQKAALFKQPYIKNAAPDVKSAIRRCPDHVTLNAIAVSAFNTHLQENQLSYGDYLDILDDLNFNELD